MWKVVFLIPLRCSLSGQTMMSLLFRNMLPQPKSNRGNRESLHASQANSRITEQVKIIVKLKKNEKNLTKLMVDI